MPAPLQWDAPRRWNFDISFGTPTVYLLRDHVTLITDLIGDWTTGPPSDFDTFIPMTYGFKFSLKDYRINLYLNDHNVVDHPLSDGRNSACFRSSVFSVHPNLEFKPSWSFRARPSMLKLKSPRRSSDRPSELLHSGSKFLA